METETISSSLPLFARLSPSNRSAKRLFAHAIKFMKSSETCHINCLDETISSSSPSRSDSTEGELTEASYDEAESVSSESATRSGSFILSFQPEQRPLHPLLGWRAGRGTSGESQYGVDFLLASPRHSGRRRLPTIAFYLRFHTDSAMLMLVAGSKFVEYKVDGRWTEISTSSQHVLLYEVNEIRTGTCEYELRFCLPRRQRTAFNEERDRWISGHLQSRLLSDGSWQIPSAVPYLRTGNVIICSSLAYGGFGWVYLGVDCRTGDLRAIKEGSVKESSHHDAFSREAALGTRLKVNP